MAEIRGALSSSQTRTFSPSSLTQYRQLQSFVSTVSSSCSVADNLSQIQLYIPSTNHESLLLKIVTFLLNIRDRTWGDIKGVLTSYAPLDLFFIW